MIVLEKISEGYETIYNRSDNGSEVYLGSISHCIIDGEFYARNKNRELIGHYEKRQDALDKVLHGSPTVTIYS